jgi:hypothetical protein
MAFDYTALKTLVRLLGRDPNSTAATDPQLNSLIEKNVIKFISMRRRRAALLAWNQLVTSGTAVTSDVGFKKLTLAGLNISEVINVYLESANNTTGNVAKELKRLKPWEIDQLRRDQATTPDLNGLTPTYFAIRKLDGDAGAPTLFWWPCYKHPDLGGTNLFFSMYVTKNYPEDATLPDLEPIDLRTVSVMSAVELGRLNGLAIDELQTIGMELPDDVQAAIGLGERLSRPRTTAPEQPT